MKQFILMLCISVMTALSLNAQSTLAKGSPVENFDEKIAEITTPAPITVTGVVTPPVDITTLTPQNIVKQLVDPVYTVLLVVLGLLSMWIPGLNKIGEKPLRIAALAIVLGIGFVTFGGATFWKIALSSIVANAWYLIQIKPIAKALRD